MVKENYPNFKESGGGEEEILRLYQEEKRVLEEIFGSALSTIEAVGLKRIVGEVVRQVRQNTEKKESDFDRIDDYYTEIDNRYFLHFFGIKYDDLLVKDELNEATKEYLRRRRDEMNLI